jgi:hypothetical protein
MSMWTLALCMGSGLLVTEENIGRIPDGDVAEWNAALLEYDGDVRRARRLTVTQRMP